MNTCYETSVDRKKIPFDPLEGNRGFKIRAGVLEVNGATGNSGGVELYLPSNQGKAGGALV